MRYTGRASEFEFGGKRYAHPDHYARMTPERKAEFVGTYDKPIAGMTQQIATHLIEQSNLHSFEEGGEDLAEKLTAPNRPLQTTSPTVVADAKGNVSETNTGSDK